MVCKCCRLSSYIRCLQALNFCTLTGPASIFWPATNHHKQNARAVLFHIIAQPANVHYSVVFFGTRSRTLNHERKAVWEVQMVLSLTPQHSDHSQGACTYGQCGPFLLWRRWHRKKKEKKRPSLQTAKANTQTVVTLRVSNPSFLLLGACSPRKIKAFSAELIISCCYVRLFWGQLLKCKCKLFKVFYFIQLLFWLHTLDALTTRVSKSFNVQECIVLLVKSLSLLHYNIRSRSN